MFVVISIISKIFNEICKSRMCCAQSVRELAEGPRAVGIPTNNQRGLYSVPCRLCGGLANARHVVPTILKEQSLYIAVEESSARLIAFSMIPK